MKCIKLHGDVRRVTDDVAAQLVKQGWVYCPKSDWKATKGRKSETVAIPEEKVKKEKTNKKSKKGKKSDEVAPNPDPAVPVAPVDPDPAVPVAPVPETKAKKAKKVKEAKEATVTDVEAEVKKPRKTK